MINFTAVAPIANCLLYEGYLLWPYRASSLKNRQRFSFGGLLPGEVFCCEALLRSQGAVEIELAARFLQPVSRRVRAVDGIVSDHGCVGGTDYYARDEATERTLTFGPFWLSELSGGLTLPFSYAGASTVEPINEAVSWQREKHAVRGECRVTATPLDGDVHKLVIEIINHHGAATPREAELRTLHAAHAIVGLKGGAFMPLVEAPARLAAACHNVRAWPVVVGDPSVCDTLLCSPIILADFAQIAPESAQDMFDATENDELLTLNILALSDQEKAEMAAGDERARALLARAERFGQDEQLRLHGVIRSRSPSQQQVAPGTRVRLRPKRRADVMDIVLRGKAARVESIEHDAEGRGFVTVTVDDDPGRDLARFVGHRFFFMLDEVEPLGGDA